ncbi:MFS transporter [Paenibacillus beijingensis]|uniref:MFS transporter n=1 Tax=Paenibacillus beijingensis TaxID=1126833 RepID=A0A0D5NQH9_9BACL|nr:MFS transporter [Paenibacillus beijingensis]
MHKGDAEGKARSGGTGLDAQAVLLLLVLSLFNTANALSGTFVPVYLWKASQSYALIGWYSFSQFGISGLTFWLAGKWVKQYNKMNTLRLGVALSGCFYLTVLLLGNASRHYYIPLGALNGIAGGFFWLAYNVVYFEITEPNNRDRYNGWAGLLGSCAGIVAPWLSGLIISRSAGTAGYRIIFSVSIVIFAVSVVLSFWLRKRPAEGQYGWFLGVRELRERGNPWRKFVPAIMMQGVREGVFLFLVGLAVYIATRSEQKLGTFTLITSLVALGSFWTVGRWLRPRWRRLSMLVGVIAVTAVILPLLLGGIQYGTLLMFGIGTSLFIPLYMIPMTSSVFDLIGRNEQSARARVEYIVLREAALTAGRLIGLTAYLLVLPQHPTQRAITWLMLGVGAAPIAGWWLIRHYVGERRYAAKRQAERP